MCATFGRYWARSIGKKGRMKKNPRTSLGSECGLSMKGRKSARGSGRKRNKFSRTPKLLRADLSLKPQLPDLDKHQLPDLRRRPNEASMKPRPMQNPNIVRIQIETLRQQRSQLARARGVSQRVPQFNDTTPFARLRTRFGARSCRDKMRVVLGGHGPQCIRRTFPRP
jgi:hypothetical protein